MAPRIENQIAAPAPRDAPPLRRRHPGGASSRAVVSVSLSSCGPVPGSGCGSFPDPGALGGPVAGALWPRRLGSLPSGAALSLPGPVSFLVLARGATRRAGVLQALFCGRGAASSAAGQARARCCRKFELSARAHSCAGFAPRQGRACGRAGVWFARCGGRRGFLGLTFGVCCAIISRQGARDRAGPLRGPFSFSLRCGLHSPDAAFRTPRRVSVPLTPRSVCGSAACISALLRAGASPLPPPSPSGEGAQGVRGAAPLIVAATIPLTDFYVIIL